MFTTASAEAVMLTALCGSLGKSFDPVVCRPLGDRGVRSGYSINTGADGSLNITGKL